MRHIGLLLLCVPLLACQSVPTQYQDLTQPREVKRFIAERRVVAQRLEASGAWREALREWQLIDAATPGDGGVERAVRRLEREIEQHFARHREAASKASRQGDLREARRQLLKALALRPGDAETIRALKAAEARLAYAAMPAAPKVAKGQQSEVDVYTAQRNGSRAASPSAPRQGRTLVPARPKGASVADPKQRTADLLSAGRYEAALKNLQGQRQSKGADPQIDAQIAKLKRVLAERHYARGVAAFREARYGEAVNEFEHTLRYDPDHHKARFYHSSAEALHKP